MNIHNRFICHHWRANVDMQIILDVSAAISDNSIHGSLCNNCGDSSSGSSSLASNKRFPNSLVKLKTNVVDVNVYA
jgi:hypothetical protein